MIITTSGVTTGKQLSRSVELLRQVGAPLVGVVLNNAPPEEAYGYKYGYYRQDTGRNVTQKRMSSNGSTRKSQRKRAEQAGKGRS